MTGRDPDLGGIHHSARHHPVWGFGADDMHAVQQQHERQARRCRWTVAVLVVLAAVVAVVAYTAGRWM